MAEKGKKSMLLRAAPGISSEEMVFVILSIWGISNKYPDLQSLHFDCHTYCLTVIPL